MVLGSLGCMGTGTADASGLLNFALLGSAGEVRAELLQKIEEPATDAQALAAIGAASADQLSDAATLLPLNSSLIAGEDTCGVGTCGSGSPPPKRPSNVWGPNGEEKKKDGDKKDDQNTTRDHSSESSYADDPYNGTRYDREEHARGRMRAENTSVGPGYQGGPSGQGRSGPNAGRQYEDTGEVGIPTGEQDPDWQDEQNRAGAPSRYQRQQGYTDGESPAQNGMRLDVRPVADEPDEGGEWECVAPGYGETGEYQGERRGYWRRRNHDWRDQEGHRGHHDGQRAYQEGSRSHSSRGQSSHSKSVDYMPGQDDGTIETERRPLQDGGWNQPGDNLRYRRDERNMPLPADDGTMNPDRPDRGWRARPVAEEFYDDGGEKIVPRRQVRELSDDSYDDTGPISSDLTLKRERERQRQRRRDERTNQGEYGQEGLQPTRARQVVDDPSYDTGPTSSELQYRRELRRDDEPQTQQDLNRSERMMDRSRDTNDWRGRQERRYGSPRTARVSSEEEALAQSERLDAAYEDGSDQSRRGISTTRSVTSDDTLGRSRQTRTQRESVGPDINDPNPNDSDYSSDRGSGRRMEGRRRNIYSDPPEDPPSDESYDRASDDRSQRRRSREKNSSRRSSNGEEKKADCGCRGKSSAKGSQFGR